MERQDSDRRDTRKPQKRQDEWAVPGLKDWKSLFHAVPQSVLILDPSYTVTAVNLAALKAMGKTEIEVVGRKCFELFHGSGEPVPNCPMSRLMADG